MPATKHTTARERRASRRAAARYGHVDQTPAGPAGTRRQSLAEVGAAHIMDPWGRSARQRRWILLRWHQSYRFHMRESRRPFHPPSDGLPF